MALNLVLQGVVKAVVGGLAFGLGIASAVLIGLALLNMHVDCTTLTANECHFAQQIAGDVSQLQGFTAVGCAFVAGGLFLTIRSIGGSTEKKHTKA